MLVMIALIVLPFVLNFHFYPILPETVETYRGVKEGIALLCAASIFLITIYRGKFRQIQNPWLLILLGYLLIHPLLNPPYTVPLFNTNIGDFWIYKPLSYALIYFGMFWAIQSAEWSLPDLDRICSIISWVGFISAIYVFCQALGLDQWQNVDLFMGNTETENAHLSGTFSHPNYAASFLVLAFPFAVWKRRWWMVLPIVSAVFLIDSKIATLSLLMAIVLYVHYLNKKYRIIWWSFVVSVLIAAVVLVNMYGLPDDKGRFAAWSVLAHDILKPWISEQAYPLTGYGIGAFRFLWVAYHQSPFLQAHFEFLEFGLNVGLIGVCFLIFSIIWLLVKIKPFTINREIYFTITLAFLISLMQTVGLFVWQIEPHRFYTVLFIALLHNTILKGNTYEKVQTVVGDCNTDRNGNSCACRKITSRLD